MQVHSINNCPSFTALKISPNVKQQISKEGKGFVEFLEQQGAKLADVKRYNVVVEDSIHSPKVKSANCCDKTDFFAKLKEEENYLGKSYEYQCGVAGETCGGFYPDEPKIFRALYANEAAKKYAEFKTLGCYEQAGEYSRLLEKYDLSVIEKNKAKEAEKFAKLIQKEELENAVVSLIDKYKLETPEPQNKSAQNSFWKKLFF